MSDEMTTCEFHGHTRPKNYPCNVCLSTDQNILQIWREVREVAKQVRELANKIDQIPAKNWEL